MCGSIECGTSTDINGDIIPCTMFSSGNSASSGIQSIVVSGSEATGGAEIDCFGDSSCRDTRINGNAVAEICCGGPDGCKNSGMTIIDPLAGFSLECGGERSCDGSRIDVIIPESGRGTACPAVKEVVVFGVISCGGPQSCLEADITIRNEGCNKVIIEAIECVFEDSCFGTRFNFIGDIDIAFCELAAGSTTTSIGLDKCPTTTTTTATPAV